MEWLQEKEIKNELLLDGVVESSGSQQRLFESVRQFNKHEPICRIKIILTAFINHSDVSVNLGIFIGKNPIDFMKLQRGFVILVLNTNCEFEGWLFSTHD